MSKGCAHIASTESTECPEPRNQGSMIGIQSERSGVNYFTYVQQVSFI